MGADIFHPKLNSNRLVVPVLQKKYNGFIQPNFPNKSSKLALRLVRGLDPIGNLINSQDEGRNKIYLVNIGPKMLQRHFLLLVKVT